MTRKKNTPSDNQVGFEREFVRTLLMDVTSTLEQYERSDKDEGSNRRGLIRNIHAAIEGVAWAYRGHVQMVSKSMDMLTEHENVALSEIVIQVTDQGKISTQPRFISLIAMVRLITRIAIRINPTLSAGFETSDWENFRSSVLVRNRLTHPKCSSDLQVSDAEIAGTIDAFFWFMDLALRAMEASNAALAEFAQDFAKVLQGLKSGDPDILATYRNAIATGDD